MQPDQSCTASAAVAVSRCIYAMSLAPSARQQADMDWGSLCAKLQSQGYDGLSVPVEVFDSGPEARLCQEACGHAGLVLMLDVLLSGPEGAGQGQRLGAWLERELAGRLSRPPQYRDTAFCPGTGIQSGLPSLPAMAGIPGHCLAGASA